MIKYELSLWQQYPGATSIDEQKVAILASDSYNANGAAMNIVLNSKYTGETTLSFDLPLKYVDIFTGEFVKNPLCDTVHEKSFVKLWRDEKWFDPFDHFDWDSTTQKYVCTGAWKQGRWYDFVIDKKVEKRSKKKLYYSYTCSNLFVNELSRTGYNLEFHSDSQDIDQQSIGTIHELAERVTEGTDWTYLKTEIFPDYEEKFDPNSGETIKEPKPTDQISYLGGLKQYANCYSSNYGFKSELKDYLESEVEKGHIGEHQYLLTPHTYFPLNYDLYWYTDNNEAEKYWNDNDDEQTEYKSHANHYINGVVKTNLSTQIANKVILIDNGQYDLKTASKFSGNDNGWYVQDGYINSVIKENTGTKDGDYCRYLTLKQNSNNPYYINLMAENTPLYQGQIYAIKVALQEKNSNIKTIQLDFFDGLFINAKDYESATPEANCILTEFTTYNNDAEPKSPYYKTYYYIMPTNINKPHIRIRFLDSNNNSLSGTLSCLYIYEFKGYTQNDNQVLLQGIGARDRTSDLIYALANLPDVCWHYGYGDFDRASDNLNYNIFNNNPAYLPCGTITSDSYKEEQISYLIEPFYNGEYHQIWISKDLYPSLTKITSNNADKRRAISGEKSNRFSLLTTICETFYSFAKFIVKHTDDGHIARDDNGNMLKYYTMTSELGRQQFNGFTYGLNLEGIERTVDAEELVTKVYIDAVENENMPTGLISINQSNYNDLKENFIYNFSYYYLKGMLGDQFLQDYNVLINGTTGLDPQPGISLLNSNIIEYNQELIPIQNMASDYENEIYTKRLVQTTLAEQVAKLQRSIGWEQLANLPTSQPSEAYKFYMYNKTASTSFKFPEININSVKFAYTKSSSTKEDIVTATSLADLLEFIDKTKNTYVNSNKVTPVLTELSKDDIKSTVDLIMFYQEQYNTYQKQIEEYEKVLNNTDSSEGPIGLNIRITNLKTLIVETTNQKNKLISDFEHKYQKFIIEGEWSDGDDYVSNDTYYLDASRAVAESCIPKVSYNISALDISKAKNPLQPDDETWGEDFIYDVGDTTYVKDTEMFGDTPQKAMVESKEIYVDVSKPDKIILRNYETRFEELFQSIAASVTKLSINENIYARAGNFDPDGAINVSILKNSFEKNKDIVISSLNNTVIQDKNGILVIDNDNNGNILRIVGKGIFISRDGGLSYTQGLTADGINAELITAGQIDTSKVRIRSSNIDQYVLDENGLTAYKTYIPDVNSGEILGYYITRFDQFGVYATRKGQLFTNGWYTIERPSLSPVSTDKTYYIKRNNQNVKIVYMGLGLGWRDNPTDFQYGRMYVSAAAGTTYGFIEDGEDQYYTAYQTPESYIEQKSVFSLTEDGLNIQSDNNGHIKINTRDSNITAYDKNNDLKVKLGYIKSDIDSGETIYGLDIYDGTLRLYGVPYDSELDDDDAAIYFSDETMYVNGILKIPYNGNTVTFGQGYGGLPLSGWFALGNNYANGMVLTYNDETTNNENTSQLPHFVIGGNAYPTSWSPNKKTYDTILSYQSAGLQLLYEPPSDAGGDIIDAHALVIQTAIGTSSGEQLTGGFSRLALKSIGAGAYVQLEADVAAGGRVGLKMSAEGSDGEGSYWGTWTSSSSNGTSSDENNKNSFTAFDNRYDQFYDNLNPLLYKYNDGQSNRFHTGFIAQDINEAFEDANIESNEQAMVIITKAGTDKEAWYLRYEELIALNTWQIQKLKSRIAILEQKLEELTSQK